MEIDEISKFIAPLTVGFIAAYLGSLLALRKFKREKSGMNGDQSTKK
ncbi:MAG: hypothetical protein Sw2PiBPW_40910 [Shewanella algae]